MQAEQRDRDLASGGALTLREGARNNGVIGKLRNRERDRQKKLRWKKGLEEDAPPEGRTELFVEMRTIVKALGGNGAADQEC